MSGAEVEFDGRCFGCGPLNSGGLHLVFLPRPGPSGSESVCEFSVPAVYQSWKGIVHGGMIALILDEAVGWAAWHAGRPGVTGRLEVKYRRPLHVGEEIRVVGRVERERRSLVYTAARIERLADGEVIAEATAVLMDAATSVDPSATTAGAGDGRVE